MVVELNQCPLQDQQVLLTTEKSLLDLLLSLNKWFICIIEVKYFAVLLSIFIDLEDRNTPY